VPIANLAMSIKFMVKKTPSERLLVYVQPLSFDLIPSGQNLRDEVMNRNLLNGQTDAI